MQLTPRSKRVIDLAYDEARQLSNNYIGTEHLLLGLLREGEGLAARVLAKLGVDLESARAIVRDLQDSDGGLKPPPAAVLTQAERFAQEYAKLPTEQQAALTGEGLPINQLPDRVQLLMQELLLENLENVNGKTFVLDPNAALHVNITQLNGHTHYSVIAKASFLVNLLVKEA